ncbi:MAG: hypothetical protein FWD40_05685 [Treponema sp.]|nr:hypothetical protein [Treponema sp.]
MSNKFGFDSEHWWSNIRSFAAIFLGRNNKQTKEDGPEVMIKPNGLEKAKEVYFKNLMAFKNKTYGKKTSENKVDRHKMIALYIKSFLEVSPFYVEARRDQNRTIIQNCPNEYFSMELMCLILSAWNEKECGMRMIENEEKWFIILLNHYRLEINTLDVLSLAQIIYYIEDKYINRASEI